MLKPPRRSRSSALPPGAEHYRPRPKPVRRARPPAPPADLHLTDAQLELLHAIASERAGARIPDEAWSTARDLRAVGLVELEPPPPSIYASRPAWRPALGEDRRPWRATITEHGRRVLEQTGGSR